MGKAYDMLYGMQERDCEHELGGPDQVSLELQLGWGGGGGGRKKKKKKKKKDVPLVEVYVPCIYTHASCELP